MVATLIEERARQSSRMGARRALLHHEAMTTSQWPELPYTLQSVPSVQYSPCGCREELGIVVRCADHAESRRVEVDPVDADQPRNWRCAHTGSGYGCECNGNDQPDDTEA